MQSAPSRERLSVVGRKDRWQHATRAARRSGRRAGSPADRGRASLVAPGEPWQAERARRRPAELMVPQPAVGAWPRERMGLTIAPLPLFGARVPTCVTLVPI